MLRQYSHKLVVITVILFLLSFGFIGKVYAAVPSLLFSPGAVTVAVGEEFDEKIMVDTAGENAGGADVLFNFNPQDLEVLSITTGTIFGDYPSAIYDNITGKVIISGVAVSKNNLFSGNDLFATVKFRTKSVGASSIEFEFTPGDTRDSNIAVMHGNGDVLAYVNKLEVTSQGGSFEQKAVGSTSTTSSAVKEEAGGILGSISSFVSHVREILNGYLLSLFGNSIQKGNYDTITNQAPKTTLAKTQDAKLASYQSGKSPSEKLLSGILVISVIVLVVVLGVFFLRKRREKTTVYTKL